jgi:hypothetical protein
LWRRLVLVIRITWRSARDLQYVLPLLLVALLTAELESTQGYEVIFSEYDWSLHGAN